MQQDFFIVEAASASGGLLEFVLQAPFQSSWTIWAVDGLARCWRWQERMMLGWRWLEQAGLGWR
jgi:hypothetical protein